MLRARPPVPNKLRCVGGKPKPTGVGGTTARVTPLQRRSAVHITSQSGVHLRRGAGRRSSPPPATGAGVAEAAGPRGFEAPPNREAASLPTKLCRASGSTHAPAGKKWGGGRAANAAGSGRKHDTETLGDSQRGTNDNQPRRRLISESKSKTKQVEAQQET
ncbi:uncharacterized protein Tco025E_08909 [Trypanosoma conorhini]|uniref:Uncharacterized protein n=1 Tax=Trypanosoma conorhini TaxID=83891 RepID=A0A3R7NBS7_9TRYP|nr:uncharacterized protein Tco025E_08909 [Trypanosoma conorhini]RNF00220.1 hypothetical protein Tco025E_08909 [Trypanosoma conorhini]